MRPDLAAPTALDARAGRPGLVERALAVRDRLLASPAFRRAATAFPLTRPVARRRARALFDLCAGFVYSQVLASCVRLRLFEILAEGPQGLETLSRRLGLPRDGAERLLLAAVALRLLERRGGERFGLGPLGAALVNNPGLAAMIEHHALLYRDLADPLPLLRGERPETSLAGYWAYAGADRPEAAEPGAVLPYTSLMAATQPLVAAEILAAYDFRRHRRLLDIGGGSGAFLLAAGNRHPHLELALFDLPPAAEAARARFDEAGLGRRATAFAGDFLSDPLPEGADAVALVRVAHDHDEPTVRHLLARARAALPPGGTLLLAEPMAGMPGAEPVGDAYFGFYLLAMGQGRPRTATALTALLREAGFREIRQRATRTPLITGLLVAKV